MLKAHGKDLRQVIGYLFISLQEHQELNIPRVIQKAHVKLQRICKKCMQCIVAQQSTRDQQYVEYMEGNSHDFPSKCRVQFSATEQVREKCTYGEHKRASENLLI